MTLKKYTIKEAKKLKGKSDLERLKNMTEKELEQAAKSDPDSAWPTENELKDFKPLPEKFRKLVHNENNNKQPTSS